MDSAHESQTHGRSSGIGETDKVKSPNFFERAKEEIVEIIHPKKEPDHGTAGKDETQTMAKEKIHDKETHGTSNDIDDDTPIDKIKGPNIFQRAKEEVEALVEAIHPK